MRRYITFSGFLWKQTDKYYQFDFTETNFSYASRSLDFPLRGGFSAPEDFSTDWRYSRMALKLPACWIWARDPSVEFGLFSISCLFENGLLQGAESRVRLEIRNCQTDWNVSENDPAGGEKCWAISADLESGMLSGNSESHLRSQKNSCAYRRERTPPPSSNFLLCSPHAV